MGKQEDENHIYCHRSRSGSHHYWTHSLRHCGKHQWKHLEVQMWCGVLPQVVCFIDVFMDKPTSLLLPSVDYGTKHMSAAYAYV